MQDQIKALIPLLEQWASLCDAEYQSAKLQAAEAEERLKFYLARSANADKLLQEARDAANGTFEEVPL